MNDFYFIYFPIGYDFIKTMESTFKYLPNETNVIVVTPHPQLINENVNFNLIVLKLDDIRDEWSKQNEHVIYDIEPDDYRKTFFENHRKGIRFPFGIHRYIMPWLVERNITKFAILDSDILLNYHGELTYVYGELKNFFQNNEHIFAPIINVNADKDEFLKVSEKTLIKYGIDIDIIKNMPDTYNTVDAYILGFWFNSSDKIELFFNLWDGILKDAYNMNCYLINSSRHIVADEWLFALITYIFTKIYGVNFGDPYFGGYRIGKHIYHPENYYYYLHHQLYCHPKEDGGYGLVEFSNRKDFINNNREDLIKFYNYQNGIITNRIHEVIHDFEQ